jgi:Kef-type K+ transport system membrane component KefB
MNRIEFSNWHRDLGLALLLMIVPMIASVFVAGGLLTITAPTALAIGFFLRPRQLWPIWLGSVVMMWIVYGLAELLDLFPDDAAESGETWWSFALESFVFMAMLVLLPLWIGRLAGRFVTKRRTGPQL